ncbi:MAG: serine protease [Alphaproteobacteria bacterium]|nr:serine protease [Alphaproteobacteria bacterium]
MFLLTLGAFAAPFVDVSDPSLRPADPPAGVELPEVDSPDSFVVGGAPSAPGTWQSTVSVMYGSMPGCTGTLVAPNVVITAAHCVTPEAPTAVRTGSVNAVQGGQLIPVANATFHPSYDGYAGVDLAVLQLQTPSNSPITTIATDCVEAEAVYDGAPAAIVGFGSTNPQGTQYPDVLYEAMSSIRDADCSQDVLNGMQTTCEPALRPAGELAAGGNGIDSCYGDSGGPLYVQGDDAIWYLAGVTSRGFAAQNCGSGGVYVRPDTHLAWIEGIVGPLPRPGCGQPPTDQIDDGPPAPVPDPKPDNPQETGLLTITSTWMPVRKNRLGGLELTADGADGELVWTLEVDGQIGTAAIDGSMLFYTPPLHWAGEDLVVVSVTDATGHRAEAEIAVYVGAAGGCDQGGGAPAGFALVGLLALLGRARRD